ncbi:glutamate racemase [Streptomyces sp. NPDC127084]|uniref:glutamate racemase n=1 Tax=Streptomyces sp. NPDC127084 TaxID=3347133 RepID=UPI00365472C4
MARRIGIFDSGMGGLTLLDDLRGLDPDCEVIYLADTMNLPFGDKSDEEIAGITMAAYCYLVDQGIDALIIGCNTADAVRTVSPNFDIFTTVPTIGVIDATARAAHRKTRSGVIGVVGTVATIRSRAYEKVLSRYNDRLEVRAAACPKLGPLIHSCATHSSQLKTAVRAGIACLDLSNGLDTLILGCTAYPLIQNLFQTSVPSSVKLVTSGRAVAWGVHRALGPPPVDFSAVLSGSGVFLVTGNPAEFAVQARRLLGMSLKPQRVLLSPQPRRGQGD